MIKFSKDKVLLLHKLIAEETGLAVASGQMDYDMLRNWVFAHKI